MRNEVINKQLLYFRGRVALAELLIAGDIGKGDFVAIQAFTCSAVPEAVFASCADPLYVDVVEKGVTMSAKDLEEKVKKNEKVKALVIQHTFGVADNIDELVSIGNKYNLLIIEDCCHSFNSEWKGQRISSFSDASFYSFEWGKPISLGLGGALFVNNKEILEKLNLQYSLFVNPPLKTELQLLIQSMAFKLLYRPSTYWFVKKMFHMFSKIGLIKGNHSESDIREPGNEFKWKMSSVIQKKLSREIKELDEFEGHSKWVAKEYTKKIPFSLNVRKIITSLDSEPIYVRYPIWVENKQKVVQEAASRKVEIATWYSTPVHPYKDEQLIKIGYEINSCPNAELACQHVISLPLSRAVDDKYICSLSRLLRSYKSE